MVVNGIKSFGSPENHSIPGHSLLLFVDNLT